jgi:hypothetical protein
MGPFIKAGAGDSEFGILAYGEYSPQLARYKLREM